eukprot:1094060-Pleurochrysis_carterae.AAC.1
MLDVKTGRQRYEACRKAGDSSAHHGGERRNARGGRVRDRCISRQLSGWSVRMRVGRLLCRAMNYAAHVACEHKMRGATEKTGGLYRRDAAAAVRRPGSVEGGDSTGDKGHEDQHSRGQQRAARSQTLRARAGVGTSRRHNW